MEKKKVELDDKDLNHVVVLKNPKKVHQKQIIWIERRDERSEERKTKGKGSLTILLYWRDERSEERSY